MDPWFNLSHDDLPIEQDVINWIRASTLIDHQDLIVSRTYEDWLVETFNHYIDMALENHLNVSHTSNYHN
ncbi:unnamed protein product [Gordionus sp. m RMFG-2023]